MIKILIMCLCFNSFAQVTTVKKGEVIPYDGVLFSKDKELKLREMREECTVDKKKVELFSKMNELNQKEIDVLTQRADNYKKEVRENRRVSDLEKAIYFLAGAFITGAISYGVIKANK
jgi:hypothetical protein